MKANPMDETKAQATPVVFISYAWTSQAYQEQILRLAGVLRTSFGVDVRIDEWDLLPGQDMYRFMESTVQDPRTTHVLLMCNAEYAAKANANAGGVGVEARIISPELYPNADNTKFVPVIMEKTPDGKDPIPTFLKGRRYIDLTSGNDGLEDLARHLHGAPRHPRPALGPPPAFTSVASGTATEIDLAVHALRTQSRDAVTLSRDAFAIVVKYVEGLRVPDGLTRGPESEAEILKVVDGSLPMRDQVLGLFKAAQDGNQLLVLRHHIADFLEQALTVTSNRGMHHVPELDPARFFLWELYLHLLASLAQGRSFEAIQAILGETFVVDGRARNFSQFNPYFERISSATRGAPPGNSWIDYSANLLRDRCTGSVGIGEVAQTDFLLFIRGELRGDSHWRPRTAVFDQLGTEPLDVFLGGAAPRRFGLIQSFLDVNTLDDLARAAEERFAGTRRYMKMSDRAWSPIDIVAKMNLPDLFPGRFDRPAQG